MKRPLGELEEQSPNKKPNLAPSPPSFLEIEPFDLVAISSFETNHLHQQHQYQEQQEQQKQSSYEAISSNSSTLNSSSSSSSSSSNFQEIQTIQPSIIAATSFYEPSSSFNYRDPFSSEQKKAIFTEFSAEIAGQTPPQNMDQGKIIRFVLRHATPKNVFTSNDLKRFIQQSWKRVPASYISMTSSTIAMCSSNSPTITSTATATTITSSSFSQIQTLQTSQTLQTLQLAQSPSSFSSSTANIFSNNLWNSLSSQETIVGGAFDTIVKDQEAQRSLLKLRCLAKSVYPSSIEQQHQRQQVSTCTM